MTSMTPRARTCEVSEHGGLLKVPSAPSILLQSTPLPTHFCPEGKPLTSLTPSGKLPCFLMLNPHPLAPHTLSIPLCIPHALSNTSLLQPMSISLQRVTHQCTKILQAEKCPALLLDPSLFPTHSPDL